MSGPPKSDGKIWFAHMLRGIAALLVVVAHYCRVFWVNNDAVVALAHTEPTIVDHDIWLVQVVQWIDSMGVNLGAYGVAVFFLISGFVIPISIEHSGVRGFAVRRFFRIYPTYLFGLGLVFLSVFLYTRAIGTTFPLTTEMFFTNGSLLRDWFWHPSVDGINWTLEVELKFYILCAIVAGLSSLRSGRTLLVVGGACTTAIYLLSGTFDFLLGNFMYLYRFAFIFSFAGHLMTYMFIGTCFFNHYRGYWGPWKSLAIGGALYGMFWFSTQVGPEQGRMITTYLNNYSLALLTFAACYAAKNRLPKLDVLDFFANISYPLYAVHGVVGYILMTVIYKGVPNAYAAVAITFGAIVPLAYAIHRWVELPSNDLGRLAEKWCKKWLFADVHSSAMQPSEAATHPEPALSIVSSENTFPAEPPAISSGRGPTTMRRRVA